MNRNKNDKVIRVDTVDQGRDGEQGVQMGSAGVSRRTFAVAGAGAVLLAGVTVPGFASTAAFPLRRVAIVVPFPAGTAVDAVARFMAPKLSAQWNVPVTVENRAGGGGVIGTAGVKLAPDDGHTILFTGPPFLFGPELIDNAPYDPLVDFTPVAKISAAVYMLAATKSAPYGSLAELVAHAKKQSEKIDVGAAGPHSTATVTMMARAAGIELNVVPYRSTAQCISDAIAGHVPLVISALGSLVTLAKDGSLKALAVTGPQRSSAAPDVPAAHEAGATGFEVVSWNAAFVRATTPADATNAIEEGMRRATAGQDFRDFCRHQGLDPAFEGLKEWAKRVPAERAKSLELLHESGIASKR